jgi:hypothetical protein
MNFNDCLIKTESGEVLYQASLVVKKLGYKNITQTMAQYCPDAIEHRAKIVDKKGSVKHVSVLVINHEQLQSLVEKASKNFMRGKCLSPVELTQKISEINSKISQLENTIEKFESEGMADILESHAIELDELDESYNQDLANSEAEIEDQINVYMNQIIELAEIKAAKIIQQAKDTARDRAESKANRSKIIARLNESYQIRKNRIEKRHQLELSQLDNTEKIRDEINKLNIIKKQLLLRNGYEE